MKVYILMVLELIMDLECKKNIYINFFIQKKLTLPQIKKLLFTKFILFMKNLFKLLSVVIILSVTSIGCQKYDDGPFFSFLPKKDRLANEWEIEKIIQNGSDVTSYYSTDNLSIEYKKDGTYKTTYILLGQPLTETGDWEFDSKKENLITTPDGSSSETKFKILKLMNKELWLEKEDGSNVTETHYVPK